MLLSLDARRDRLLTNSRYTQTSGAELPHTSRLTPWGFIRQTHSAFNRGGPHCIARVLPGSSRAGSLCKSHRALSERPVTPRVESTKPHSLSRLPPALCLHVDFSQSDSICCHLRVPEPRGWSCFH